MVEQEYQQQNGIAGENNEGPKQWLAIASFVLAILGFNILWLIFWIIALNKKQLRRAALSGVIISSVRLFFVIIIIFAALIPRMWAAQDRAKDVARMSDIKAISTALISYQYQSDYDTYPEKLSELKWPLYWLWNTVPTDPDTNMEYSYSVIDAKSDHFVICAKLSEWSTMGNTTIDLATDWTAYDDINNLNDEWVYWKFVERLESTWSYYCIAW